MPERSRFSLLANAPTKLNTVADVQALLMATEEGKICVGNHDEKFLTLLEHWKSVCKDPAGTVCSVCVCWCAYARVCVKFGMEWSIPDLVLSRRMQWLGHLGRMAGERLPKRMLFVELVKRRPCHGPKKRWRYLVSADLQALQLNSEWYQLCQDRREWFECFWSGIDEVALTRKKNRCAANAVSNRTKTTMVTISVEAPSTFTQKVLLIPIPQGFPRAPLS